MIVSRIVLPPTPKDLRQNHSGCLAPHPMRTLLQKTLSGLATRLPSWARATCTVLEVKAKKKKKFSNTDLIFVNILVCCPSWVYLYQYQFLKIHELLLILTQDFGFPLHSVPEYSVSAWSWPCLEQLNFPKEEILVSTICSEHLSSPFL